MNMPMPSGGALSPNDIDFNNKTQASEFVEALLDDSMLKIESNAYGRRFWYGIVTVVVLAAVFNASNRLLR